MWLLVLMTVTPPDYVSPYATVAFTDLEACMVMGEDLTRESPVPDTYHCIDLQALFADSPAA